MNTCSSNWNGSVVLENRYRQFAPSTVDTSGRYFPHPHESYDHFWSQLIRDVNSSYTVPSPITTTTPHEVFSFDIPFPSTTRYYDRQPHADDNINKRPRAHAVERLLTKFPKLRHMLEDEEAVAQQNSASQQFEPMYCSTPTFYSGLELPPTTTSTSTIASSFVDEEYGVGCDGYNTEDLDNVFVDIDLTAVVNQSLPVSHSRVEPIKNKADTSHTHKSKHQCNLCPKTFATRNDLSIHLRTHKEDRPHKCCHCGKGFTQKSALRPHIRTHTGERPYKCSTCHKAFSDFSTYTKHNRTHTGERPYTCDICGKGFAQSGNMIRHRQSHRK